MVREIDKYTYCAGWSEEDGEFMGLCAEYPCVRSLASTREEALEQIRAVVKYINGERKTKI